MRLPGRRVRAQGRRSRSGERRLLLRRAHHGSRRRAGRPRRLSPAHEGGLRGARHPLRFGRSGDRVRPAGPLLLEQRPVRRDAGHDRDRQGHHVGLHAACGDTCIGQDLRRHRAPSRRCAADPRIHVLRPCRRVRGRHREHRRHGTGRPLRSRSLDRSVLRGAPEDARRPPDRRRRARQPFHALRGVGPGTERRRNPSATTSRSGSALRAKRSRGASSCGPSAT